MDCKTLWQKFKALQKSSLMNSIFFISILYFAEFGTKQHIKWWTREVTRTFGGGRGRNVGGNDKH